MGASFSASIQQLGLAVYVAYMCGKAPRNSSDPEVTNMLRTNFLELRQREVRRMPKRRSSQNAVKRKSDFAERVFEAHFGQ
jgi:hypothetical protein